MSRRLLLLVVALIALAAIQVTAAQAASEAQTRCKRVAGKIVHNKGERCVVLRRSGKLVTIRIVP